MRAKQEIGKLKYLIRIRGWRLDWFGKGMSKKNPIRVRRPA